MDTPASFIPAEMADLLVSGWSGTQLETLLHRHFPHARRPDAYTAFGFAASIWIADVSIAQLEARMLRARLAEAGIST